MMTSCSRCKNKKCGVAVLLTLGFAFTVLSNLDCHFALVDVGFAPSNTQRMGQGSNGIIGIGLWAIEDVEDDGTGGSGGSVGSSCRMPAFSGQEDFSLTNDDDMYTTILSGSDAAFSCVRIMSLIGLIIVTINLMVSWGTFFSAWERNKRNKIGTLIMAMTTFICEVMKMSLMLASPPCVSDDFWETTTNQAFQKADKCIIGRGFFLSIGAAFLYFCVMVHVCKSIFFVDPYHHHHFSRDAEEAVHLDDVSMPSYLQSIGESYAGTIASKISSSVGSIMSRMSGNSNASNENNDVRRFSMGMMNRRMSSCDTDQQLPIISEEMGQ